MNDELTWATAEEIDAAVPETGWNPDQTAMLLTEREWQALASICWGWKRHTDMGQQQALPHYVELCDRIIAAVDGP